MILTTTEVQAESLPAKLSIREKRNLEKYPALRKIRTSIISCYDYLMYCFEPDEHLISSMQKDENSEDSSQDIIHYFNELTALKCDVAADYIAFYINKHFTDEFMIYLVSNRWGYTLKHFGGNVHHVAVLFDKKNNLWFCLSPANIFNEDLSSPEHESETYVRSTDVFVGSTYEEAIGLLQNFEGGMFPKDDTVSLVTPVDFEEFDEEIKYQKLTAKFKRKFYAAKTVREVINFIYEFIDHYIPSCYASEFQQEVIAFNEDAKKKITLDNLNNIKNDRSIHEEDPVKIRIGDWDRFIKASKYFGSNSHRILQSKDGFIFIFLSLLTRLTSDID